MVDAETLSSLAGSRRILVSGTGVGVAVGTTVEVGSTPTVGTGAFVGTVVAVDVGAVPGSGEGCGVGSGVLVRSGWAANMSSIAGPEMMPPTTATTAPTATRSLKTFELTRTNADQARLRP